MTGHQLQLRSSASLDRWELPFGGCTVRFGAGAHEQLAEIAQNLGAARPLLVTDPGVRATGRVDATAQAMRSLGQQAEVFDGVCENPTTRVVDAGRRFAAEHDTDLLVGFGGGSALDATKGINFLLTNGGGMEDYWGVDKALRPMLQSIGVPTTAGTGSEAQRFALITRPKDRRKMACGDPKARFTAVVLDPELTETVPRPVAVATGIDAVTHAVESHVSTRANRISRLYSREACHLLGSAFEESIGKDADLEVRARMLLGAHLAGAAIECSMLGAAHACANPLTARFDVTHGVAVGILLPHVVRYNRPEVADRYVELEVELDAPRGGLESRLEAMVAGAGLPLRLRDHGVDKATLPVLAAEAATQWTANFNPRPVAKADLRRIYESAY